MEKDVTTAIRGYKKVYGTSYEDNEISDSQVNRENERVNERNSQERHTPVRLKDTPPIRF
jgi:hypothetical protein